MDVPFSTRVPSGPATPHLAPPGGGGGFTMSVTWRVIRLERTEDHRWKLAAVSDHPQGDWQSALAIARLWFKDRRDDVERGEALIRVSPIDRTHSPVRV